MLIVVTLLAAMTQPTTGTARPTKTPMFLTRMNFKCLTLALVSVGQRWEDLLLQIVVQILAAQYRRNRSTRRGTEGLCACWHPILTGHNNNHCCYIVNTKLLACFIDKDKKNNSIGVRSRCVPKS
ncbi:hypothetical protein KDW93_15255 [Burkholderia ambifaria]|uniref:Uncharacterized protein n=1 Tax=Burkholderia ambifaria TaxID=152480 RepID=A0AA41E8A1_9BURK|nr:hypothetical protein [Burkholderia ambifaria]MBR8130321.1 hypothetical protein [Burkholderia ambifaria]